jgi:hypothetical protein
LFDFCLLHFVLPLVALPYRDDVFRWQENHLFCDAGCHSFGRKKRRLTSRLKLRA